MERSFRNLEVWIKSRNFRIRIYKLCKSFPKEEKFSLTGQLIRSSRSVTANLAEGYGRFHYKENIQFCRMARGSLYETLDHLICARDCGYIRDSIFAELDKEVDEIGKMLNGYISYLRKRSYTGS